MRPERSVRVLSAWCAVSPEAAETVFPALVTAVPPDDDLAWRELLHMMDAVRLVRILAMVRARDGPEPLDLRRLTLADSRALWDGAPIGKVHTYWKTALPYEAQARVAYDVFFHGFVGFVARRHKAAVLHESDFDLELFVPAGPTFELEQAWAGFVGRAFSAQELAKSFAVLVNSVKLADRGFSALDVPVVSLEQARFLAAFYLANVESLRRGDRKRQGQIADLRATLGQAGTKQRARAEKSIAKVTDELAVRFARYGPLYEQVDQLCRERPEWMAHVRVLEREAFTPLAGVQIAKAGAKIGKCVSQMVDLAELTGRDLFRLPVLLAPMTAPEQARAAGDSHGQTCYSCGAQLGERDRGYAANKFIFESPSQRLQSGGSQTQPKVCATCAAVSFVSPIKVGAGRLIIRMREKGPGKDYLADEQLRMLILGEMNIVAGRYAMLQATDTVAGDLVADRLGGLQYALHRVGCAFEVEVFERYEVEALIRDDLVALPSRYLAWVHCLGEVFRLQRREWADKAQFAALGRAIRHVQHEEVIFAVYELLSAGLIRLPPDAVRASQLEHLRAEHVRWLLMEHRSDRAQFFTDVAAMTGLLYALCGYVRSKVRAEGGNQRIEVRKVIERCGDPYQLNYTVAGSTGSEMATLYWAPDLHFSYDRLKAFLVELGIDVTQREILTDKGQGALRLYFDDVAKAYTHLFQTRYKTSKEQRDFTYELKLSLHSRFADLIEPQRRE